jgi:hypothetical protein
MGTVDGNDVHSADHLIKAFPIGRVERFLNLGAQAFAIMVVDLHAEGARA